MGIPDNTVQKLDDDPDVFMTIDAEARKNQMSDMDVWVAWKLGVAAYMQMRVLGATLPHDSGVIE
jgi:hypothetical protein